MVGLYHRVGNLMGKKFPCVNGSFWMDVVYYPSFSMFNNSLPNYIIWNNDVTPIRINLYSQIKRHILDKYYKNESKTNEQLWLKIQYTQGYVFPFMNGFIFPLHKPTIVTHYGFRLPWQRCSITLAWSWNLSPCSSLLGTRLPVQMWKQNANRGIANVP
jgi:hypothetical protein